MADWSTLAELNDDVVFFEYVKAELAKDESVVFVWDLDKTYLDTHFESLTGLYRTIKEKAFQKRNVPGTSSLVRALTSREAENTFPIYFVTASPPQMERRIREKLELDGIKPYGIFCKDNLRNLRPSRFRRLTQQVGFKLQSLMQLRTHLGHDLKQILWGDDSESDAVIYSIYSDICSRRLNEKSIRQILSHFHVRGEQTDVILKLQKDVPELDPVSKIYINLASDTDPDYYAKFGRRTLASFNTFQIALDLHQEGHLTMVQLLMVAEDMVSNYAFTPEELASSFNDLIFRRVLHVKSVAEIQAALQGENLIPRSFRISRAPISEEDYERVRSGSGPRLPETWVPAYIDYLHDFR
jgi:hypothetical protein